MATDPRLTAVRNKNAEANAAAARQRDAKTPAQRAGAETVNRGAMANAGAGLNRADSLVARAPASPAAASTAAPGATPGTPAPQDAFGALTSADRNAYTAVVAMLKDAGLESLAPKVLQIIQGGVDDSASVGLLLQDTAEYKQRFSGNDARRKAGLSVLSPGEYLALERSYKQIARSNGLPPGFYDQQDDFTNLIASDVSPSEYNDRVTEAVTVAKQTDPAFRQQAHDWYGVPLTDGDIAAYMLDPQRALPTVKANLQAAAVGGAAVRQGLGTSQQRAEQLAGLGVTGDQAQQGYGNAAQVLPQASKLGAIYRDAYGQTDAENEFLLGDAAAARKRTGLAQQEQNTFGGSGALDKSSLTRSRTGSY